MALWQVVGGVSFDNPIILSPKPHRVSSSIFKPSLCFLSSSLKCCCIKKDIAAPPTEGFSVLSSDIPWARGSTWSTMAMYMFNLHIPFGIGGLSIASYALKQPILDQQTQALSLLVFQILELVGTAILLRTTATSEQKLVSYFKDSKLAKERNWLLVSAIGFGFIVLLVFFTSLLSDRLVGTKAVNNPILKEILLSSNVSKAACVLIYCIVTPLLEEIVYRGFLLTSLCSTMKWQHTVLISSAVFSAAHFSGENFLQLFIIGCVLGCCYCRTGKLSSPILTHSLYNAMTLIITLMS